jgi:hypothetical protein
MWKAYLPNSCIEGTPMTVELVMQVSRGDDDRLSGTVRLRGAADTHVFSGTLELMRVFEDLVPRDRSMKEAKPPRRGEGGSRLLGSPLPPDARTS